MVKVLYVLVGITLKQALDEWKSLSQLKIAELEKEKAAIKELKLPTAVLKGSQEAAMTILRAEHATRVAPEVQRISRQIIFLRGRPLRIYVAISIALLGLISWLEWIGVSV